MSRHGWVKPLPGGAVARCGGPVMCPHCMGERLAARGAPLTDGKCFYCGARQEAVPHFSRLEDHKPDCIWIPFAEAHS